MLIERPGDKKPLNFVLHPDRINLAPSIGITPSGTTSLAKSEIITAAFPGSAAARSNLDFKGDRIVSINGEKIEERSPTPRVSGNIRVTLGDDPRITVQVKQALLRAQR